jgi:hypothetical protein
MHIELETKPEQSQVKSLFDEVKKIFPNAWKRWDSNEDQQLIANWMKSDIKVISETHMRTKGAIASRLNKFGLVPIHYTESQIDGLIYKLKNYNPQISNFLKEREIKSLFHFTHIDNLSTILKHGLLGTKTLKDLQIPFINTDQLRIDSIENGLSMSVSEPNRFMLSKKIRNSELGAGLVLLELDPMYLSSLSFLAFPTNAASRKIREYRRLTTRKFNEALDLELLFNNLEIRNKFNLAKNIPTDPQSEIMIIEDYPASSIKKIHFQISNNKDSVEKIRDMLKEILSFNTVLIEQESKYFNNVWHDNNRIQIEWDERQWNQTWENT